MTAAATSLSRSVCSARPGPAAEQVAGEHVGRGGEDQAEVPEPLRLRRRARRARTGRGSESVKEKPNSVNGGAARPLNPPVTDVQVLSDVLADEHQPERRDAEVDAAQPGGDRAEQQPGQPGDAGRPATMPSSGGQPRPPCFSTPPPGAAGDERVGDRADRQEEGVRQGQLAGRADQDVQPDRADDRAEHGEAGAQPELVDVQRQGQQDDGQQRARAGADERPARPRTPGRCDAPVASAVRVPATWRAARQTRVSSRVPKSPEGRTSRTAIMTMYGTTTPNPRPRKASWSW